MRRFLLVSLLAGLAVLFSSIFAAATRSAAPVQSLTINPTSWTTSWPVGGTTTQYFDVTFSGKGNSGPLTTGLTYDQNDPRYFSVASGATCQGVTLSSKNPTCTITVQFHPATTATSSMTLSVAGRKQLSTSATLSGTGAAALPGLSINDPSFAYGTTITFTVTMSSTSATPVTFDWATADGTAVSGTACGGFNSAADYVGGSGSGTIAAGSTSTTIVITTCGSGPGSTAAINTNFTVTISSPVGATITDATGTGTLLVT